ncbi:MAG: autotransporter outer membrane beta-barrel domain-containing protein [Variovorax sp.]
MNKSYRSVWNQALGAWVAVSETTSARGKRSRAAAATIIGSGLLALASASGAQVQVMNTDGGTYSAPLLIGAGGYTIDANDKVNNTFSGAISGAGRLSLINSGTSQAETDRFILDNASNTYGGGTSVGSTTFSSSIGRTNVTTRTTGSLGAGPAIVLGNAELRLAGAFNASGLDISVAGSSNTLGSNSGIKLENTASLGDATVRINGAGSYLTLVGSASAGSAQITNNGGRVDLITGYGGSSTIRNIGSTGAVFAAGNFDLSGVTIENDAGRLYVYNVLSVASIGSLSGAGDVLVGSKTLSVGGLGYADTISGVISDTGPGLFDSLGGSYIDPATQTGGSLVKVGSGMLTLSGNNTYTGGTTVSGGTLRLGDGGTSGSVQGAIVNNAAVVVERSDIFAMANAVSGTGSFTQRGTGTTVLTGANSYGGSTTVEAGTLRAGAANALSAASAHSVVAGGTLDLAGLNQSVAGLANGGTVSLVGAAPGTTLTVTGPYVGNNGSLRLGTTLGASGPSDRLVLDGAAAVASGTTAVQIVNLGGLGGQTVGNGIEVISARNGATTTAQTTKSAFALGGAGHVDAGAFEYRLFAADAAGAGENWYLRSDVIPAPVNPPAPAPAPTPAPAPGAVSAPTLGATPAAAPSATAAVTAYRAEAAMLAALPSQLRQSDLAMIGNMHRRFGDDDASAQALAALTPVAGALSTERRAWARAVYSDIDIRQAGTVSPSTQGHVAGVQAGTDLYVSALGDWRAGLYVGTLDGNTDVSGAASGVWRAVGDTDLRARYLGAYASYSNATGFYADTVLQYGSHRYTIRPLGGFAASGKGNSLTASVEVGQAFALGSGWQIEPQAQLSYRRARLDDLSIPGARVEQDDSGAWTAGLGLRVKGDFATAAGRLQPYARVGVVHGSDSRDVARFGNGGFVTPVASSGDYTSVELATGATLSVNRTVSVYGEVGKLFSTGGDTRVRSSVQGAIGVRVRW